MSARIPHQSPESEKPTQPSKPADLNLEIVVIEFRAQWDLEMLMGLVYADSANILLKLDAFEIKKV